MQLILYFQDDFEFFLSFMSFAYVNVNCMNRSLLFVNRMTPFIVYKSFVQLLASKSKLFISQTENYNMKKLEMMRLGLQTKDKRCGDFEFT